LIEDVVLTKDAAYSCRVLFELLCDPFPVLFLCFGITGFQELPQNEIKMARELIEADLGDLADSLFECLELHVGLFVFFCGARSL
jgi:hypothetical protein